MFINVSANLPLDASDRPPIVLIHGAANSSSIWRFWQRELSNLGWPTFAIDLRGHGDSEPIDLSRTSMHDYAEDALSLCGQLGQRPVLIGWSMGGLIAMMVAAHGHAVACVALAPSTPSLEIDDSVELRSGEFGSEVYGIVSTDPADQPTMPDLDREERAIALGSPSRESQYARDERRRGIVITALACPLLVVTGANDGQAPSQGYDGLWLDADRLNIEGASHWGLVLNRRALKQALPSTIRWLENALKDGS